MRIKKTCIFFLGLFIFFACHRKSKVQQSKAVYYSIPEEFEKSKQSPINIITKNTESITEKEPLIVYNFDKEQSEELINKGTTIEIEFEEGSGITFHDEEYLFDQLHFHTPSEHLIDGITYPMEMHMVHHKHSDKNYHVVIACLFKEGNENSLISDFLKLIPKYVGDEKEITGVDVSPFMSKLEHDGFYSYRGSLTTPPFTETVTWIVVKDIFEASPKQIQRINELEGNNARHIKPLFNRKVKFFKH